MCTGGQTMVISVCSLEAMVISSWTLGPKVISDWSLQNNGNQ